MASPRGAAHRLPQAHRTTHADMQAGERQRPPPERLPRVRLNKPVPRRRHRRVGARADVKRGMRPGRMRQVLDGGADALIALHQQHITRPQSRPEGAPARPGPRCREHGAVAPEIVPAADPRCLQRPSGVHVDVEAPHPPCTTHPHCADLQVHHKRRLSVAQDCPGLQSRETYPTLAVMLRKVRCKDMRLAKHASDAQMHRPSGEAAALELGVNAMPNV